MRTRDDLQQYSAVAAGEVAAALLVLWLGRGWLGLDLSVPVLLGVIGLHLGWRLREGGARAGEQAAFEREREVLDEQLARAREVSERAGRVKSHFLANMSHEIRTPLTAILGYAELLLDGHRSQVDRLDCVQTIRRSSHHLLQLVDDILDLTKLEAGTLEVHPVPTDPGAVLGEVVSLLHVRAAEKRIELSAVYATDVPTQVLTDPARLRQILLSVVGNGIKFTERGSVRIVARCDFEGQRLEFEVADTGIGMDAATLARLYHPFTQADGSATRVHGGSGLGLAIARPLAKALGGDLHAASIVGRGSQVVVTIGTGDLRGVGGNASPTVKSAPAPYVAREVRARVLLAEDGPDNQRLVSAVLRMSGARVDVVENGRDAADTALDARERGEPYDVVLMDMQMPVLDGYAATALLRERGYAGPIVALTAHALRGDRERCLAAGCDDHVPKPIDRALLLNTVLQWTGERPQRAPAPADGAPIHSTYADDPDMAEICAEFASALPGLVERIGASVADGDRNGVRSLAHQLKGAAGSYGYQMVTDVAAELEKAAKADVEMGPRVDELRELARRIAAGGAGLHARGVAPAG